MTADHDFDLVGRRCIGVRRMRYHVRGDNGHTAGPIEFAWSDREHTTIDAATDWTLTISPEPWLDPFASASAVERETLGGEVGLWEPEVPKPDDPLAQVVGRDVTAVGPILNEVGEPTGLDISFGPITLLARVIGGEIAIDVLS